MGAWRRGQAGLQPHHTGVGKVKAHVGPGGLTSEPHTPVSRILLPEREVGVNQRKRQLLKTVLDVHARVGGLKVWQPQGSGLVWSSGLRSRGSKEWVKIPTAIYGVDQIQAGVVDADGADFEPSPP